jgi:hypothetical protein
MSVSGENNDINDPVVQDVLNEFRDELLISKNNKDMNVNSQNTINDNINLGPLNSPNSPSYLQHPPLPPHLQYPPNSQYPAQPSSHPSQISYPSHPYTQHPSHISYSQNKNDYMLYIDIELIKKNLIIVIIVFLIYFSGIINNIYDKIPEYLQENILSLDIYIKTASLFIILYIISYTGYI